MTTQRLNPLPAEDRQDVVGKIVRSFLAGDPLRCIAAAAKMGSWETMHVLNGRIADRGEEQRAKALRSRCSAAAEVLVEESDRLQQLRSAGIETVDIPKVLAALGVSVDVEIAVELLRSMEIFTEIHHQFGGAEVARPSDTFSLLYIFGHHCGLEPNYRLALGKIPLPGIDEFRRQLAPQLSEVRIADIIAIVETAAAAIRTGNVVGIRYSDYHQIVRPISRSLGGLATGSGLSWPVPAKELRRRLGAGSWDAALSSVGLLQTDAAAGYIRTNNFAEAARGFKDDYEYFGSPKDVASYDSWTIAETAAGRDRPSVIAIRRHFGTWESVIGAVLPPEVEEDEYDGLVDYVRAANNGEEAWAKAGELISEILANMPWNSFLSIQYLDEAEGLAPYAQASPSADGVWFEVVSEQYLPTEKWPLDAGYLTENGWFTPDSDCPNWYKGGIPHSEAGHQILEGLRFGRGCGDADKLQWHTGEFPSGPGPDGGVTVDDALAGAAQTLHNAA